MKQILSGALLVFSMLASAQVQEYVYKNDFNDPLINEKESVRDGHSIQLKNGFLHVEQTKNDFYWCIAERLYVDPEKDYEIEIKMKPYDYNQIYSEFGLLFGLRNVSMFNSFTMSADGMTRVSSRVYDNEIPFLNPTSVPDYDPGDWAIFKIVRKWGKMSFYVNNHLVFEKKKMDFMGRWFGWYTNSKMGLQLDYFYVKQNRGVINLVKNAADYSKERLKGPVNSDKDEVCPVLSSDGKQLYYGKFVNPSTDFYYVSKEGGIAFNSATIDTNGNTSNVQKVKTTLAEPWYISSIPNNGSFYAGEKDNQLSASGVSIGYFNAAGANEHSKNIKFAAGSNVTIKHAAISSDEKVMVMSGYGNYEPSGLELYVSTRNGDVWTAPVKIASLNTKGDEVTPFISKDMKQLYFSSDGHPGYGFSDVFVATRLDNTWQSWGTPENLGKGVNDAAFNEFFMMPDTAVSNYAFMASSFGHINNLDLYRVKMKKVPPVVQSGVTLHGKVIYPEGEQHNIKFIEISVQDKNKTKEKLPLEKGTDKFTYQLLKDELFSFKLLDTNFIITEIKDKTSIGKTKERHVEVKVQRIMRGESFVLENIYFNPNQYDILPASHVSLDALVNALKNNSRIKIEVQGHTSKTSEGEAFDLKLSNNRALAVKNYLISKGIAAARIQSKGYGYTQPLYTDNNDEHQAKNRRVEIKILEK